MSKEQREACIMIGRDSSPAKARGRILKYSKRNLDRAPGSACDSCEIGNAIDHPMRESLTQKRK